MVVYGQYGRTTTSANKPERARKVISGYLGNERIAMISGENTLGFSGAPLMALIDLRTMKLLMFEVWTPEEQRRHHIDEMIEHCKSLD